MIVENLPGVFKNIEEEMSIHDAIKYCKDWIVQRKWLKANKVDFAEYKEEIEFQKIYNEFKFDERIERVQVTRSMQNVAITLAAKEI